MQKKTVGDRLKYCIHNNMAKKPYFFLTGLKFHHYTNVGIV